MKSKVVISVLAVIGLVALSATAAQAAGGAPFPITSFFVCQSINGDTVVNPDGSAKVVTVQESVLLINPKNAKLGGGTLACAVAKLLDPLTGLEIMPNPSKQQSDGVKCYNVTVPKGSGGPVIWGQVNDDLFPGGQETNVPVTSFQYVCSPATFRNPSRVP